MTSILATRQPSERSFERLYRAHVQDVYRYSLMLLRNRADAEDVAQTTFMKAYRAIMRGERPLHPRRWLITIAHNTCRSRFRDDKRRPQEIALDETVAGEMPADDADVDVPELLRALSALSFNQRSALVMRELEGRSYREIAELLDVSPSAVETLLFRARRALREQLEGTLTCGEAEHALSLQLDGRLVLAERARLRAHLRECRECASLARRQRARRAALRSLGPLPLPASLASWGGAASGSGVAIKVAALLAAGVAAAGASQQRADAETDPRPQVAPTAVVSEPLVRQSAPQAPLARRPQPLVGPVVSGTPLRSRTSLVHDPAEVMQAAPRPPQPTRPDGQSTPIVPSRPPLVKPPAEPLVVVQVPKTPAVTITVPELPVPLPVPTPIPEVTVPAVEIPPLPVEIPTLP